MAISNHNLKVILTVIPILLLLLLLRHYVIVDPRRFHNPPRYIPEQYIDLKLGDPLVSGGGCEVLFCPDFNKPYSHRYFYSCRADYTWGGFTIAQLSKAKDTDNLANVPRRKQEILNPARTTPVSGVSDISQATLISKEANTIGSNPGMLRIFDYHDVSMKGPWSGKVYEQVLETDRVVIVVTTDTGCIPEPQIKSEMIKMTESLLKR